MIEFPEDMATAIAHLKATLPLLTRHQLPPHPIHYGLWYLYASRRSTELQRALDGLTAGGGSCSEADARSLFSQYLLEEFNGEQRKATGKLHLLTQSVQGALQDSLQMTNRLDRQLGSSREQVRSATRQETVELAAAELVAAIDELTQANRDYRRVAQSADAEIDRLRTELNHLQRASDIDELTQLYNRGALFREIGRQIAEHGDRPLSLILMDIDHFKSVNDRFGHLMGDRVLQRLGTLLLQQLRTDTLAARFGGEEFAVLCPDTTLAAAIPLAERLRDQIQRLRIKVRNADTVLDSITASFGVTALRPKDTADTLFERADKALYAAKSAGRNICRRES